MAEAELVLLGPAHKLRYVTLDGLLATCQKGRFVPPFPSLSSVVCHVAAVSRPRFARKLGPLPQALTALAYPV